MEYNYLSKYQIVEGPLQQLPNRCAGCGSYDAKRYLDWGLSIEFFGTVYICLDNCLTELVNQFGYHSPEQFDLLQKGHNDLLIDCTKLSEENKELKSALASITSVLGMDRAISMSDPSTVEQIKPQPESESEHVTDSDEVESRSNEQDDEPGSSDVSSDDSLNKLFTDFDI